MKTIFYIENEDNLLSSYVISKIRHFHPSDALVVISAGEFAYNGELLPDSPVERAYTQIKAGADFVLSLPSASILGGYGKKDFASAALVQRLHTDCRVVIPCVPLPGQSIAECRSALKDCAMLIFRERPDYRQKLSLYLKKGISFREAQIRSVASCLPETEPFFAFSENCSAVRLLDAMLQLYYMVDTEFLDVSDCKVPDRNPIDSRSVYQERFDKNAAAEAKALVGSYAPERFLDISGSSADMIDVLYRKKEMILRAESFEQIVGLLSGEAFAPDAFRMFLLKAILGLRHSSMQICGLHVYVPYCRLLAGNREKQAELEEMEASSWVPFILPDQAGEPGIKDYHFLLQADEKLRQVTAGTVTQEPSPRWKRGRI